MQTPPPQHRMPCPTDPLLGSLLPTDIHTGGGILPELGSAALMQSHLHTTSSSSPTVALRGHLGKGIRSFLCFLLIQHKQLMVNSIRSPSFCIRMALGEGTSGTWRHACPFTQCYKGWGNWFGFKWPHHETHPQPLDSKLLRRESTMCSSAWITRLAGI